MNRPPLRAIAASLAFLLLGGCPPVIEQDVLRRAEDEIAPEITLSSPANRSFYDSSVIFAGTVTDSAVEADDGEGHVDTVSYTVLDSERLSGSTEVDAHGTFVFEIDTHELFRDQRIGITAEDWNGNSTTVWVDLVDPGVGPDISITSPQDDSVYMKTVTVIGVVDNRGESVEADEVAALRYEVRGEDIEGTVAFDPDDGAFSFSIGTEALSDDITIRLTATDRNGRTTTEDVSLSDRSAGPAVAIASPTPSSQYQAAVTVSGTVTNNTDATSTSEVKSFSWQVVGQTEVTELPYAAGTGAFSFTFSTVGWTGTIIVELKATDLNNRLTTVDLVLFEDTAGPNLVVDSPIDGDDYGITISLRGSVSNSVQDTTHFDDVHLPSVKYRIGANEAIGIPVDAAGDFDLSISTIGLSGNIILKVSAQDLNGHLTERGFTLSDNLPGPQVTVTDFPSFYSSLATSTITVDGAVDAPDNLLDNRMAYEVSYGANLYTNYISDAAIDDASGAFSFTFGIADSTPDMTGNLTVTIVANDKGGRQTRTPLSITEDSQLPYIRSGDTTLGASNAYIVVRFSEPIYSSPGSGACVPGNFSPTFHQNGGTATGVSIDSASRIDESPLQGGEQEIRLGLTVWGTPSGAETLAIVPNAGSPVYDHVGNPLAATESTAPVALYDKLAPWVSGVTAYTANGVYNEGDPIDLLVTFSEVVTVSGGVPSFTLETGLTDREATYQSGSGSDTLRFRYTVQSGDTTGDLDATGDLILGTATVRDAAGNVTATALPAGALAASAAIRIDTTAPTVTQARAAASGIYNVPDQITINLTFSEEVWVTGAVSFGLTSGGTAQYVSKTSATVLKFVYTVGAGQTATAPDYLDHVGTLTLAGGTVRDAAGNDVVPDLPIAPAFLEQTITIDTTAPTVTMARATDILLTDPDVYGDGDTIQITLTLSEPVSVTGTVRFGLTSGGTAACSSGTSTSTLTFSYTVDAGENATGLDTNGTLSFASGTIKDAAGNAAGSGIPAGLGCAITVDTAGPRVLDVLVGDGSASLAYVTDDVIPVTVHFDEVVSAFSGAGTKIVLNLGSSRDATYASGVGSTELVFVWTVLAGDAATEMDYTGTAALKGTATDAIGNASANPALPAIGAAGSISGEQTVTVN